MVKMELKVAKEMIQILSHGNKKEAYSMIESIIAVFICSLLLLAVLGFVKSFAFSSKSIHQYVVSYIENQNQESNELSKK